MESDKAKVDDLIDPDIDDLDQYRWDEEFQRQILGLLLNDRTFLIQSFNLVKPSYFVNAVHRQVCKILFKYFDSYRSLPNNVIVKQELEEAIVNKDIKTKVYYRSELGMIYDYYVPNLDSRDYLLDRIVNFAKMQALKTAFSNCIEEIKKAPEEEKTWSKVHDILNDAMSVDRDFDIGLEYFQTLLDRYERVESLDEGDRFTTGFPKIDAALNSKGLCRGEIGSWMGVPGVGKSLALVKSAIANLHRGKRVLYVTLEIETDKVAERFDAQLAATQLGTAINIGELHNNKELVVKALEDYVDEYDDKRLLVIKQFPSGAMDIATLRAYYSQLTLNGFNPDLVIVDYIGEMKDNPNMSTWESRFHIVRDLRRLAGEERVCVLTAMQPNKSAKEAQKLGVIDDENIADAYGQTRPLDAFWSINQIQDEKNCNIARIYTIKHRDGKSKFTFTVEYDPNTLEIREISQEKYDNRLREYKENKKISTADTISGNVYGDHIPPGLIESKSVNCYKKKPEINFKNDPGASDE